MGDTPTFRVGRGSFLRWTGAGAALVAAGCAPAQQAGTAAASPAPAASGGGPAYGTLRYFTSSEAETVVAIAERIFPADANGPGATDLHVVDFIDGQLAGQYGWGAKLYKQGPWTQPTMPGHGWQYPTLPRDVYRQSLASLDAYAQKQHQNAFAQLAGDVQDTVLKALEAGTVDTFTGAVPPDAFFAMVLGDVTRGLFSDPMYGGNRGSAGWAFLGFPGDPMAYGDEYASFVAHDDAAYNVAPQPLGARAANAPAPPAPSASTAPAASGSAMPMPSPAPSAP